MIFWIITETTYISNQTHADTLFVLVWSILGSYGIGLLYKHARIKRLFWILLNTLFLATGILLVNIIPPDIFSSSLQNGIAIAGTIATILILALTLPQVIGSNEDQNWNYYWISIARWFLVFISIQVLHNGVFGAIFAVNTLFQLNLPIDKVLGVWGAIAVTIFGIIFVSALPQDSEYLDKKTHYPKFLKVFVNWIIFPLLAIYLLILTSWSIISIIQWDWSGISVVGTSLGLMIPSMIAIVLISPQRVLDSLRKWIFRIANIGLLITLISYCVAIVIRVQEYGFTYNRYIVSLFGFYILGFCVYNLFSKSIKPSFYAFGLCAMILIATVSPWSAYSISTESQIQRYKEIFSSNNLEISNQQYEVEWQDQDNADVYSIVRFLSGSNKIQDLHSYNDLSEDDLLEKLNIDRTRVSIRFETTYYSFKYDTLDIQQYDYYVPSIHSDTDPGFSNDTMELFSNDDITLKHIKNDTSIQIEGQEILSKDILNKFTEEHCSDTTEFNNGPRTCDGEPIKIGIEQNGFTISLGVFPTYTSIENNKLEYSSYSLAITYQPSSEGLLPTE